MIKSTLKTKECLVLLGGLAFVCLFHIWGYLHAGIWSGEPLTHLTLQLETVHLLMADGVKSFASFSSQFINLYFKFPKQGYDFTAVISSYLIFDTPPTLHQHKLVVSTMQLLSYFGCCAVISFFLRKTFEWEILLVCVLFWASDTYNLVYSSFPRQNITAHLFGLTMLFFYLSERSRSEEFNANTALYLGIFAAFGTLFHYSCFEAVIAIIFTELALIVYERKNPLRAISRLLIFLAAIVAVWVAGDIYYYISLHKGNFEVGTKYPILEGMVLAIENTMLNKTPAWKIEGGNIFFSIKYLWHVANPLLLVFGVIGAWHICAEEDINPKFRLMILIGAALFFWSGTRFFAAARSIEYYMPYLLILAGYGIVRLKKIISARNIKYKHVVSVIVMVLAIGTQYPRMVDAKTAITTQHKTQEYLQNKAIDTVFVIGRHEEPLFTEIKKIDVGKSYDPICAKKPNAEYLYLMRALPIIKSRSARTDSYWKTIDVLRETEALAVFKEYNSLPLYYFEFPLKKEIFDGDDPMGITRRIYKVSDFKDRLCSS